MDESNEIFMPYSFISLQVYHLLSSSVRLSSTNEMSNANAMRFIRKNFFTRQMISGAHFNGWHNTYTKWGREKENDWMNEWNWALYWIFGLKLKRQCLWHAQVFVEVMHWKLYIYSRVMIIESSTEHLWQIILSTVSHPMRALHFIAMVGWIVHSNS